MARAADELAVSAVSMAELDYGVSTTADPLEQLRRRQRLQLVHDLYAVLPFDAQVAEYYGALATAVRVHGRDPRPRRMDPQIVATAAGTASHCSLATPLTSPGSNRRSRSSSSAEGESGSPRPG